MPSTQLPMGGGDDHEVKAKAIRRARFIATWFMNTQGITTYICLGLGAFCVLGITWYHFTQSNYIHVNKFNKAHDLLNRPYSHLLSDDLLSRKNVYVQAGVVFDENGKVKSFLNKDDA